MKNIVLVSLDTVRADVAYSGKFTGINTIRKQGVTFLNTVSSSPLTPVSHATVFTGQQPYNHGIRHLFKESLNDKSTTLTEVLKQKGYRTGAVVSCPGMNKWYGFNRGFDHYDDEIPRLPDGSDPLQTVDVKLRGRAMKRADLVFDRAKKWLDNNKDGNFFLFLHFFDAHWPYEAPAKFAGDNVYEEEVAYSDHYLNEFNDYLKENGLFDDTLIICFSDHGEDLNGLYPNDKGGEVLGHPEESGHGCLLYEQTQKVLLIIHDSQLPQGIDVDRQVRLVDLAPTLLELADIKSDPMIFDGQSLVPIILKQEKPQLIAYCETYYPEEQTAATGGKYSEAKNKIAYCVDSRFKTIKHLGVDTMEIYDLITDKYEKNNLAPK
ncbi:MAG: sulfatase [Patescibacteria group bacterium]